eukprot:CAMPEP_0196801000 /NCGR_PEP_ID=MMETSP1362-20130617/613_1 /TAXON_ID=163516 /ORGANISM="Leptocylindrus danicus, Strain CCMP1856" /LENGTH=195 /DNA_ID=CAMNT_0042171669 /DNA_START=264 /DNA_END=848 /DNA_ORIENTATION=-
MAPLLDMITNYAFSNNQLLAGSTPKQQPSLDDDKLTLTLEEFICQLPQTLTDGQNLETDVLQLFRRLDLKKEDWIQFAKFEPSQKYTRNLVSSDGKTYTLLLLCWNPDKASPIHDHPCDGCWMKVCEGSVTEARYSRTDADADELVCTQDATFYEGAIAYIADWLGYHKIGNPSKSQPAVTLHLYSPPFDSCKIW